MSENAHTLSSGHVQADAWFGGGLHYGKLYEFGMPKGVEARRLLLLFFKHTRSPLLWIYNDEERFVYPPAWSALGMDLSQIYFVRSGLPLKELRPVFLQKSFPIIVLDGPEKLNKGEQSFLIHQVRTQKLLVILLRHYYLSPRTGNPFAHIRANCVWHKPLKSIQVRAVKKARLDSFIYSFAGDL